MFADEYIQPPEFGDRARDDAFAVRGGRDIAREGRMRPRATLSANPSSIRRPTLPGARSSAARATTAASGLNTVVNGTISGFIVRATGQPPAASFLTDRGSRTRSPRATIEAFSIPGVTSL
jgi:hypothetical protein